MAESLESGLGSIVCLYVYRITERTIKYEITLRYSFKQMEKIRHYFHLKERDGEFIPAE